MMWLLWVFGFVLLFFLLAQFITYWGVDSTSNIDPTNTLAFLNNSEHITKSSVFDSSPPQFDSFLLLQILSPKKGTVTWKMCHKEYELALLDSQQVNMDSAKAILRLQHVNPQLGIQKTIDYPIELSDQQLHISLDFPYFTTTAQIGFYTENHHFVTLLTSNSVIQS